MNMTAKHTCLQRRGWAPVRFAELTSVGSVWKYYYRVTLCISRTRLCGRKSSFVVRPSVRGSFVRYMVFCRSTICHGSWMRTCEHSQARGLHVTANIDIDFNVLYLKYRYFNGLTGFRTGRRLAQQYVISSRHPRQLPLNSASCIGSWMGPICLFLLQAT